MPKRRVLAWVLPCLLLATLASELTSEKVTLSTYYPAPSGVYTQMITTGRTSLARDGSGVGIGVATPNPAYKLDVRGNAYVGGTQYVSGTQYVGGSQVGGSQSVGGSQYVGGSVNVTGGLYANSLQSIGGIPGWDNMGLYAARDTYTGGNSYVGQVLNRRTGMPAFLVNVAQDDCGWGHPFIGCPAGYYGAGHWHVGGSNGCDGASRGFGYNNGAISAGWMALCVSAW